MSAEAVKFRKREHTLLIPELFPVHMELLADAIRTAGYRVQVLRYSGRKVLDVGLKYIHNDMCYPAVCSLGQQLYAVTCGAYEPGSVALLQFQTGGGCRASNYCMVLKKALSKMGLEEIPVVTLGFSGGARDSGFRRTPLLALRLLAALTFGDMMMLLKNQVRPYEARRGDTAAVMDRWYRRLSVCLSSPCLLPGQIKKTLKQMAEDFAAIPLRKRDVVKVGIVGEVYAQYSPFANHDLERFLEEQACEYRLPGVLGFLHYCLSSPLVDRALYGGRKGVLLSRILLRVLSAYETALDQALQSVPQFSRPAPFSWMREQGTRILDCGVKMGEGWYLSAEMAELVSHGYDNILCVQPFGCLPNHIAGRGTFRRFRELYPDANLCSVDFDASASWVNQENRIKLMLSTARARKGMKVCETALSC